MHLIRIRAFIPLAAFASLGAIPQASGLDPLNGDYSRGHPLDVRIMSYNTKGRFIADANADAAFNRILVAMRPDIICFEEIPSSLSAAVIAARLNSIMPIGGSGWQVHMGLLAGTRNVLVARYPLTMRRTDTIPASSTRGVTIALADLPDADYSFDVYLLGVHLKCCGDPGGSEDISRQRSADAIANWLGDARGAGRPSGNNVVLTASTPMIVLGDFNLVGGPQPEATLLTGDIQTETTFGPDVKGDWDISDMLNLDPRDPFTGNNFTWQGSQNFPPSALDRFMVSDSAMSVAAKFVLNTSTMTPAALSAAGLQAGDTLEQNSSDHLPILFDLRAFDPCAADTDGDQTPDCTDGCPEDPYRIEPGVCGCNADIALHGTGDMNGDGSFDGLDIRLFAGELAASSAPSVTACPADINLDESVNAGDIDAFVNRLLTQ